MKRHGIFFVNYISDKIRKKKMNQMGREQYLLSLPSYNGKKVLDSKGSNQIIKDRIKSGKPFMAGRFGATELNAVMVFDFEIQSKYEKTLSQLMEWSGFFPKDISSGCQFKNLMINSIGATDFMGIWNLPFERYYLKKYADKHMNITDLSNLRPWKHPECPWTEALEHKKVLVIHPFVNSIYRQYQRRNELFPDTKILPEFDLTVLKAVQTIAGEKDCRFQTWFEALNWMYEQSMKIDFDIAILGCGAYGFPLAAMLKREGRQVIHLGGATQLLFGIRGKRWDENPHEQEIRNFYNDSWIYPESSERPANAQMVEDGCYW
ncbi:MAG: hypothetical protein HFG75_12715 [Hungatella sp.]|nr:hypothetical protein [Hungatella sp.]